MTPPPCLLTFWSRSGQSQGQGQVSALHRWFMQNSLKLNTCKTQLIVMGTRQMLQSVPPVTLTVSGSTIHESDRVRNLGVVMDRTLSYDNHIGQLVGRCTGLLIGLSHVRYRLPKETLTTIIVNTLVLSTEPSDTVSVSGVLRPPKTCLELKK